MVPRVARGAAAAGRGPVADERGDRISHLVATTRLAEIRRGTPRARETLAALQDAYATFTEGFLIPPLVAARSILDGG